MLNRKQWSRRLTSDTRFAQVIPRIKAQAHGHVTDERMRRKCEKPEHRARALSCVVGGTCRKKRQLIPLGQYRAGIWQITSVSLVVDISASVVLVEVEFGCHAIAHSPCEALVDLNYRYERHRLALDRLACPSADALALVVSDPFA